MEFNRAGGDNFALRGQGQGISLPIGDQAAGALDHRHQGADVEAIEIGTADAEVEPPGGQSAKA